MSLGAFFYIGRMDNKKHKVRYISITYYMSKKHMKNNCKNTKKNIE